MLPHEIRPRPPQFRGASLGFGYVASWAGGGDQAREAIRASGSRIATTARTILAGLNEQRREAA